MSYYSHVVLLRASNAKLTCERLCEMSALPLRNIDVSNLHLPHPRIRAMDWRSPLIYRLLQSINYEDSNRKVRDSFRGNGIVVVEGELHLHWSGLKEDFEQCVNTYQEANITE